MNQRHFLLAACLTLIGLFAAPVQAADAGHPVAQVVSDFNAALSKLNVDGALALVADGGVQFQLRPAHPGMPLDHPLTEGMVELWQTASAILLPNTASYTRKITIKNIVVDGELAVVWTDTHVETLMKKAAAPRVHDFSEMYFLINKDNTGWKIAGAATNRPMDSLDVS